MACQNEPKQTTEIKENNDHKLAPTLVTDTVPNDSDDPAIWINHENPGQSLILGTDKEAGGGIYAFDVNGKIVKDKTITPVERPNNIDMKYGFQIGDSSIDIAVFTERLKEKIRVVELPSMKYIDGGGISVFEGQENEDFRAPMGIALYQDPATKVLSAIVSRKDGPTDSTYLWQYQLSWSDSIVTGQKVREFGQYSGSGEIEAIAVDDELGYVFYSDEAKGIRKYHAHPDSSTTELALFGQDNFKEDREGIAILKTDDKNGFLLISDQQSFTFEIYTRNGGPEDPHLHKRIGEIPMSTIETDGCDIVTDSISPQFPKGVFVAMSEGGVFHYYDVREITKIINQLKLD